ncbi:MAG TPA: phosphoglycerate kinase [Chloroflexota bacterium]|nr:phosphoglycerate kinase [Chloroflexota bacterium]
MAQPATRTLESLDVAGRRALVRVDFNVPLKADGGVGDATRLRASLPTVRWLLNHGARAVILMSHLGRPDGKPNPAYSLRPVAASFAELLGQRVEFAADCVGDDVERAVRSLEPGAVLLLENLRFHPEEETNDPGFARRLANLGDVYINDAFGTAHRAHASTVGIARYLPSAAGLLMQREIEALGGALESPKRPFVGIVGGAKISTKIAVLENLLPRVDKLLVGGAMMFTFLKARGCQVGRSLVEDEHVALARRIAEEAGAKLVLPADTVAAPELRAGARTQVVDACAVPDGLMGLDVGPRTVASWARVVQEAGTVLWNGPLGAYEVADFAKGTAELAKALADSAATSIVGGGDLVAAIEAAGVADRMSHVSTGGGASLEFIEGKVLPGVAALAATES